MSIPVDVTRAARDRVQRNRILIAVTLLAISIGVLLGQVLTTWLNATLL
jgi:hypothetical protein